MIQIFHTPPQQTENVKKVKEDARLSILLFSQFSLFRTIRKLSKYRTCRNNTTTGMATRSSQLIHKQIEQWRGLEPRAMLLTPI